MGRVVAERGIPMGRTSEVGRNNLLSRRQIALGVCAASVLLVSAGCAVNTEGEASKGQADLSVDNIEQLRNLRDAQGLRVYVAGFERPGDGGEGVFVLVPSSRSSTVVDDVGYLVQGTAGVWQRQSSTGDVSVKWFGAKGDGAGDDTIAVSTAAEVAARLQRRVFVPAGTYKVDGIGSRVALASIPLTTDSQDIAKLAEFVPQTGRTINYYASSVN
jgi:pectate lyase-like protein